MKEIFKIKNITKKFSSSSEHATALKKISFSIEKGDVYGIIGLSGAGKSTLLRALARLETPCSGKILFHDVDINTMKDKELQAFRKNIGMIFQHFNLLTSRTVAGNIAYPMEVARVSKKEQEIKINELLKVVDLVDKKDEYVARLSGGQKQRVGIARALANNPEVLLCDEATSALDPRTTKEILSLLKGINKNLGVTIVLITHEMEVIKQICNKVALIEKGEIIEQGLVSTIFSDPQHPITKSFLQRTNSDLPLDFLKIPNTPNRKILRLIFKGKVTEKPIISEIVKLFDVDINILQGRIDNLDSQTLGMLLIELTGSIEALTKTLKYFDLKEISFEEVFSE